ncbi:MAG: hypothetical protein DME59_07075 [Verrucomicrobia bacterium]|nr:MAG: hypothetical protein DME59_07075 [Verrucomicrobiota bacterium]PYL71288.1 MAG: hypothetical protein DMF26_19665 [Verrucomicrobiota bacterium]
MNGWRDSLNRYYDSTWRSQSPQPHAENGGNDQGDPAYVHWDCERSDGDLGLIDQPQQMHNCKNPEQHAGDAQSSFW